MFDLFLPRQRTPHPPHRERLVTTVVNTHIFGDNRQAVRARNRNLALQGPDFGVFMLPEDDGWEIFLLRLFQCVVSLLISLSHPEVPLWNPYPVCGTILVCCLGNPVEFGHLQDPETDPSLRWWKFGETDSDLPDIVDFHLVSNHGPIASHSLHGGLSCEGCHVMELFVQPLRES